MCLEFYVSACVREWGVSMIYIHSGYYLVRPFPSSFRLSPLSSTRHWDSFDGTVFLLLVFFDCILLSLFFNLFFLVVLFLSFPYAYFVSCSKFRMQCTLKNSNTQTHKHAN